SSFYTYHLSQLPIYKHFLCTTLFRSLADLLIVVAVDERADALVGEDFVDEAVEDAAVHHVDARHAFFDGAHGVDGLAAAGLGDGVGAVAQDEPERVHGDVAPDLAVDHETGVGREVDDLGGAQGLGDLGGE